MRLHRSLFILVFCVWLPLVRAADQSKPGAGNARAASLAKRSPRVQWSRQFLVKQAGAIRDPKLRAATLDLIANPDTCVRHRAGLTPERKADILQKLIDGGLLEARADSTFPNGVISGVFTPIRDEGAACPKLPQPFEAAPGSSFGGHHSYPGGLMLHEAFNEISSVNFAGAYRRVYGSAGADGGEFFLNQDLLIAAPIWHDWAKAIVFQWNADGTEFDELEFGGDAGSKTGAHHILGIAEAIKRGMTPEFVITLASAHAPPANSPESKISGWIQSAAILARVDPVANGYLRRDAANRLHLPALRKLGQFSNTLLEYSIHNLSDSDFTASGPAVRDVQNILAALAPEFGFHPAQPAEYNNGFRNPVLSYCSAERLLVIYGNRGLDGVRSEIGAIRPRLRAQ